MEWMSCFYSSTIRHIGQRFQSRFLRMLIAHLNTS